MAATAESRSRNPEVARVTLPGLIALSEAAAALPLVPRRPRTRASGAYLSAIRGRGMEFDEVRQYQAGDDVRSIEWRVTARTGKPHTKLFREERERPVIFWIDFTRSMFFATRGMYKAVVAARAAALLAWSATRNGDRVGGLVFSETMHRELEPGRGKSAVLHFLKQIAGHPAWEQPLAPVTDARPEIAALRRMARVARPGSLIVLASDFRHFDAACEAEVLRIGSRNDVMLLLIYDPFEERLPPPGNYRFADGRHEVVLNTADAAARHDYEDAFARRFERVRQLARARRLSFIPCVTTDDVLRTLQRGLGAI